MSKTRNKLLVEDDRWKRKGGAHKPRQSEPNICPECKGTGYQETTFDIMYCETCEGTGEIWE